MIYKHEIDLNDQYEHIQGILIINYFAVWMKKKKKITIWITREDTIIAEISIVFQSFSGRPKHNFTIDFIIGKKQRLK